MNDRRIAIYYDSRLGRADKADGIRGEDLKRGIIAAKLDPSILEKNRNHEVSKYMAKKGREEADGSDDEG